MSGPELVVRLAARWVPSWTRDRYVTEFIGELRQLQGSRRWVHALGVLATGPALRIAILRARAAAYGLTPRLGCLIGLGHSYHVVSTDDGDLYARCRHCGKDSPDLPREVQGDWSAGGALGFLQRQ